MRCTQVFAPAAKWVAAGTGIAAASYAAYAGVAWLRYGHPKRARRESADKLLDIFMPNYQVVERHTAAVDAPADLTFAAATEMDLESCAVVRGIFKAREMILRSKPAHAAVLDGIVAAAKHIGWGVLAELPGREIVFGSVTKPWEPNPIFRSVAPDEFAAFEEPGYVKIAWTLRADSSGSGGSVFRTETRAIATDAEARRKFRWYWSFLSPGIVIIRRAMLPLVKAEAERRRRE